MAAFRFRLQPELDRRKQLEEQQQLVLAELERERIYVEQLIRSAKAGIDRERDDLRELLTKSDGGAHIHRIRVQQHASLHQVGQASTLAVKLAGILARVEHARAELASRVRDRLALEKLYERRFEAWKQARRLRENREMDDLTTMRHARTGNHD